MAGYKTVNTWSAPDIQFDKNGKRIRPESPLEGFEVCRSPFSGAGKACVKFCGQTCQWGEKD